MNKSTDNTMPEIGTTHQELKSQLDLGIQAFNQQNYAIAIECLSAAMTQEPSNPLPCAYLAFVCVQQGLFHEARNFIAQSVKIAPERADIIAALGEIFLKNGRPSEALEYLRKAVHAQPDLFTAYPALAQSLHLTGQTEEAISLLQATCGVAPANIQSAIKDTLRQIHEECDLSKDASLLSTMEDGLPRIPSPANATPNVDIPAHALGLKKVKFCRYLIGDINFEPEAIQPCCNTREITVPSLSFRGGRVDMQAYTEHIGAVINALQNRSPLCTGCPYLHDMDTDKVKAILRKGIRFRTVSMNQHRYLCNCRCVYCMLWQTPSQESYAILPALESLWQQRALSENCFFSWGGGEPSMLQDFEEASRWIFYKGFFQNVHTNALRYSPVMAEFLAGGKGSINVSLDSANPETYKAVKGVNGFVRVTENLRRYIEAAADRDAIHVKYIIFALNNQLDTIAAFFDLCSALGVVNVQFSFDFREINGGKLSDTSLEAALFFIQNAKRRNMRCSPFFVDDTIMRQLEKLFR